MGDNVSLTAVCVLALEGFDNMELAAFNNAIQLYGTVPPTNLSFEKARKFSLVEEDGRPCDLESLRDASAWEVNKRVREGRFK